ncbi:hypothetical protein FPV67DRAFT_1453371 [Lyophyllum atratum]|nr:hypothetical protein FPV67DRAFT_1453371 [Lyophyllum atratum]
MMWLSFCAAPVYEFSSRFHVIQVMSSRLLARCCFAWGGHPSKHAATDSRKVFIDRHPRTSIQQTVQRAQKKPYQKSSTPPHHHLPQDINQAPNPFTKPPSTRQRLRSRQSNILAAIPTPKPSCVVPGGAKRLLRKAGLQADSILEVDGADLRRDRVCCYGGGGEGREEDGDGGVHLSGHWVGDEERGWWGGDLHFLNLVEGMGLWSLGEKFRGQSTSISAGGKMEDICRIRFGGRLLEPFLIDDLPKHRDAYGLANQLGILRVSTKHRAAVKPSSFD